MNWFNESRIQRWDPVGLSTLARGVEGFLSGPNAVPSRTAGPHADVHVDADRVVVRVELPGFGPDDVQISLDGRVLWVRGESGSGGNGEESIRRVERGFRMPFPIAAAGSSEGVQSGIEAQLEHGLLEVRLARAEADRPRQIPIGGGTPQAEGESR